MADRGAWAPGTFYPVGDTVTALGDGFVCSVAHTSSSDFEHDAAYWSDRTPATPGGNGTSVPSRAASPTSKSSTYTATTGDLVIATGTFTVTLPAPASGSVVTVKNIGTGTVTVAPNGAEKIDTVAAPITLAAPQAVDLISNGTDWFRV